MITQVITIGVGATLIVLLWIIAAFLDATGEVLSMEKEEE